MKYRVYICLIVFEILVIELLSKLLNVGTVNTWLATVGLDLVFLTICVMLYKIAKSKAGTDSLVPYVLYFAIFVIVVTRILNSIIFLMGWI